MIRNWEGHWDRRNHPRVAKEFQVTVLEAEVSAKGSCPSSGENLYVARAVASRATGTNISRGGLALQANKPYRAGTVLAFEVTLPEPEDSFLPLVRRLVQHQVKGFRALCQVIWVEAVSPDNYRVGVRFIDTDERRSGTVDHLIAEAWWLQRFTSGADRHDDRLTDLTGG